MHEECLWHRLLDFSKDSDVNWGCYLSQEALSHLMQWINEDYEQSELKAGNHFGQDELKLHLSYPTEKLTT